MPIRVRPCSPAAKSVFSVVGVLLLGLPLQAWNATGHRIVAAIAYDRLNAKARARIDELLSQHPDFKALAGRDAFLAASVWPDVIKGDARFYDDTRANAQPTPLLPGFPSMARHTNWHYVDIPFSPDGTPLEPTQSPNALMELQRILREPGLTAYDLPWLVHLTGDVHQPLHCTSRFTKSQPKGDQGGNLVFVTPGRNLHAFWDDLAGSDTTDAYVNRYAAEITGEFVKNNGQHPRLAKDPKKWIDESFQLDKRAVYTFGPETGSREHPLMLPPGYEDNARAIARIQLAKAGVRLAAALNAKLGR
jgi:S1/P1 Nuclease